MLWILLSLRNKHKKDELLKIATIENNKIQSDKIKSDITDSLSQFDFMGADTKFQNQNYINQNDYNELKIKYVYDWFKKCVSYDKQPYELDYQQVQAVIDNHKNSLVAARAGSGKTRVLVAKIIFLVAKYNINSDKIVAFVFNKDASREINTRLMSILVEGKKIIKSEIAITFHAFAYKIVYKDKKNDIGEILIDPDRTHFIQDIVKEIPSDKIYKYFRDETLNIDKQGFDDDKKFYDALRIKEYETLDGKWVKSESEKIICDFLFEHDITYYYEQECYMYSAKKIALSNWLNFFKEGKDSIKPDFYLPDSKLVWEHWAITGKEKEQEIERINKSGVIGSYEEYKRSMDWKKIFYERKWIDSNKLSDKGAQQIKDWKGLIQTNRKNKESREKFEERLKQILESHGVVVEKLPQEQLIAKVLDKQTNRFTKIIVSFIDRAEQGYLWNIDALKQDIKRFNKSDSRTQDFLEFGLDCYTKYIKCLSKQIAPKNKEYARYSMDFAQLMTNAASQLRSRNSDSIIKNKKYILIDEFQDFSKTFLNFINATKALNNNFNLMCVGDDWQAINRFAGSDVEYFQNFENYFTQDCTRLEMNTNYRSSKNIVDNAKHFIKESLGEKSDFVAHSKNLGKILLLNINDVFVELRTGYHNDDFLKSVMTISKDRAPEKKSVQYIKAAAWIINNNKDKNIKILHRNNNTSFSFMSIERFYKKLKEVCVKYNILSTKDFDKRVSISTINSAKGLESDVVILLEVDDSIIPHIHHDTNLYEIFGETPVVSIDDQKRLFYVAITRAKEQLWVLHDIENISQFINYMDKGLLIRQDASKIKLF
ncbi:MAG: UvrD-helicase domain-containing protein [Rickettsiales bacterium]|nr:UvrD-helicase domain-containing protein [Rickettsiales bacterium]